MFAGEMRKTYALSLIQKFPDLPKGRPFPRISEADIITGLHDRIVNPVKLSQGFSGLCVTAAFFYCVLNYKPELYAQYVIDLFTTGKARLGAMAVEPSAGCRIDQPPPDKIAAVDWVALASLRDFDNLVLDLSSVDEFLAQAPSPAGWPKMVPRELATVTCATTATCIFAKAARKSPRSTGTCASIATFAFSSIATCSTIGRIALEIDIRGSLRRARRGAGHQGRSNQPFRLYMGHDPENSDGRHAVAR